MQMNKNKNKKSGKRKQINSRLHRNAEVICILKWTKVDYQNDKTRSKLNNWFILVFLALLPFNFFYILFFCFSAFFSFQVFISFILSSSICQISFSSSLFLLFYICRFYPFLLLLSKLTRSCIFNIPFFYCIISNIIHLSLSLFNSTPSAMTCFYWCLASFLFHSFFYNFSFDLSKIHKFVLLIRSEYIHSSSYSYLTLLR